MSENLHKMVPFCVFLFKILFFIITQYDDVSVKKFKMDTRLNDLYPWSEIISLYNFVCIGSIWLYSVCALRLRCPHHIGIGAPFAFRSPASAPLVGTSGGAGGSVLVGVVGSGDGLHTPTVEHFKQHYTFFYTFLHTHISKIPKQHYSNSSTKHSLIDFTLVI